MKLLSSVRNLHNSKLFFSKKELTKILDCYAIGVSKGNWKDYAINFDKNEASFYMFKHTLERPNCILTKIKRTQKTNYLFKLKLENKFNNKFDKIDDLLVLLLRKQFIII